jgi:Lrp/AsnC family leucine-responsive transcriptional regulator
MEIPIDETGWRLLAALQEDPRQSWRALGRAVGQSTPAVSERMRRMEQSGIIARYRVVLDAARLGRPLQAFLRLDAEAGATQRVTDLCRALPAVTECHHLSGDDGYLIRLAVRDVAELEDVIARFRLFGRAATSLILSSPVDGKPLARPRQASPGRMAGAVAGPI